MAAQVLNLEKLKFSGKSDLQRLLGAHALQASLSSFQNKLQVIKSDQDQLCSVSLNGALEHFLGLVNSISESDTNLLNLVHDEAFDPRQLIDDSTEELIRQTDRLAERMKVTANSFSQQLDKVKTLDADITRFSVSEVARCKTAIEELIQSIKTEINKKSNEIHLANIGYEQTQGKISDLNVSISNATRQESHHETARNAGIATSVVGGVAALGAIGLTIVFPPAGIAAAFAAGASATTAIGVSTVAGVVASKHDDDVDTQRARKNQFLQKAGTQQTKLKRLEAEKRDALGALDNGNSLMNSALEANNRVVDLGFSFRTVRTELFAVRGVYSRVQNRLKDLSRELEMCGFAETRKELAECLDELLGSLVDEFGVDRSDMTVLQLQNGIAGLVSRTNIIQEALSAHV